MSFGELTTWRVSLPARALAVNARHCDREAIRTGLTALRKTIEGSLEAIVAVGKRNGWIAVLRLRNCRDAGAFPISTGSAAPNHVGLIESITCGRLAVWAFVQHSPTHSFSVSRLSASILLFQDSSSILVHGYKA